MFLLLVTLLAAIAPASSENEGYRVLVVPYEYASITEALEAANPGDVIYLTPGEYFIDSVVKVDKTVYIIGAGPDVTRITSSKSNTGFVFTSYGIISGVSIDGTDITSVGAILTLYNINVEGYVHVRVEGGSLIVSGLRGYVRSEPFIYASNAYSVIIHNASLISVGCPFLEANNVGYVDINSVEVWGLSSYDPAIEVSRASRLTITNSLIASGILSIKISNINNVTIARSIIASRGYKSVDFINIKSAYITQSILSSGGLLFYLSSSSVSIYYTIGVASTAFDVSEDSRVTGGGNIFYVSEFCSQYYYYYDPLEGILDEAPELASYYSYISPDLPDNMSGPAQDKPGSDDIGDNPVNLCEKVVSRYPAKKPPEATANSCSTLPVASRIVEDILPFVEIEGWTRLFIPLQGDISVKASYTLLSTDASVVVGLSSDCISGLEKLRIEAGAESGSIFVRVISDGKVVAFNSTKPPEERVLGGHTLQLNYSQGEIRVSLDGKEMVSLDVDVSARVFWLYGRGVTFESVSASGTWAAAELPIEIKLPRVSVNLEFKNKTITVPYVKLNIVPISHTVTNTITETVTVTSTFTKTITRSLSTTKTVTVSTTRTVKVTKVNTITVTGVINNTITVIKKLEDGEARTALLLTLLGLIVTIFIGRLLSR